MQKPSLVAAATILITALAHADSPHFIRATGTLTNDGEYVAGWKEVGLGSAGQFITYVLTATSAEFQYQCYTKSNNTPQGAPNGVFESNFSTTGSFPVSRNGQITGSLTLTPHPTTDCQGNGLKQCLISVNYTGLVLTDNNNQVSTDLPDRSA